MAAVGARPVLYHHPAPAGDAASMSSYFSQGGSSTTSSSASASFSAALAPTTTTLAEQFDISEFLFDDAGVAGAPGVFADGSAPVVVSDAAAAAGGGAISAAAGWVACVRSFVRVDSLDACLIGTCLCLGLSFIWSETLNWTVSAGLFALGISGARLRRRRPCRSGRGRSGSRSGRGRRSRSWTTATSGGSTARSPSRTVPTQGMVYNCVFVYHNYTYCTIHQEHHTISTRISRSGCSHLDAGWIDDVAGCWMADDSLTSHMTCLCSSPAQELLPVLDGRVQREEAGGAGQGRPQLRGDDIRGDAQPRQPQHGVLRQPGRRLRPLLRRRHAAAGLPQLIPMAHQRRDVPLRSTAQCFDSQMAASWASYTTTSRIGRYPIGDQLGFPRWISRLGF